MELWYFFLPFVNCIIEMFSTHLFDIRKAYVDVQCKEALWSIVLYCTVQSVYWNENSEARIVTYCYVYVALELATSC